METQDMKLSLILEETGWRHPLHVTENWKSTVKTEMSNVHYLYGKIEFKKYLWAKVHILSWKIVAKWQTKEEHGCRPSYKVQPNWARN